MACPESSRSETDAPAARSSSPSASLCAGVTIGSAVPALIWTGTPPSAGSGSGTSGTIGRSSSAPPSVPGRSRSTAAAMLAPFEKPTAIGGEAQI